MSPRGPATSGRRLARGPRPARRSRRGPRGGCGGLACRGRVSFAYALAITNTSVRPPVVHAGNRGDVRATPINLEPRGGCASLRAAPRGSGCLVSLTHGPRERTPRWALPAVRRRGTAWRQPRHGNADTSGARKRVPPTTRPLFPVGGPHSVRAAEPPSPHQMPTAVSRAITTPRGAFDSRPPRMRASPHHGFPIPRTSRAMTSGGRGRVP